MPTCCNNYLRKCVHNLSYIFKEFQGPLGNLSKTFNEHVDFKHFPALEQLEKNSRTFKEHLDHLNALCITLTITQFKIWKQTCEM